MKWNKRKTTIQHTCCRCMRVEFVAQNRWNLTYWSLQSTQHYCMNETNAYNFQWLTTCWCAFLLSTPNANGANNKGFSECSHIVGQLSHRWRSTPKIPWDAMEFWVSLIINICFNLLIWRERKTFYYLRKKKLKISTSKLTSETIEHFCNFEMVIHLNSNARW